MNKTDFFEQYKDPRWQKKRLEILARDEYSCKCCCDTETELNVHHRKYIKGKKIWDYDNKYLVTLCNNCHKEVHLTKERINNVICDIPELYLDNFYDVLPSIVSLSPCQQSTLKDFIDKMAPIKSNTHFYE
jgi:hypothetical protein